ncbi:MAG: site-2 protease family protein [Chloroflexi bacterium]|nr:site-2 protease family protein [Chloroflexota bacterium]
MNKLPNVFLRAVASSGSAINLGKVFGIPIRLHFTWSIIFVLVTLSLSLGYFPDSYPLWPVSVHWATGVVTGLLFFASILTHELSHSVISKADGVPVRSITLFVFGGVAQISREASKPSAELRMAIAGPACSVAIGILFGGIWLAAQSASEPASAAASALARINFGLAFFNLIPGFPLDGGRVLRSILWQTTKNYRKATRTATLVGQGVAYAFILLGIGGTLTGHLHPFPGIWIALIGWFLENAASSSYRQALLKETLNNVRASELMTTDCAMVTGDLSIEQLVREHVRPSGRRCFMVATGSQIEGIIALKDIKSVSRDKWPLVTTAKAMTPIGKLKTAHPDDSATRILEIMDEADINQVPVVVGNRVVGVVARDTLVRLVRTRSELED